MSKLYMDESAEREATDVGKRFMNSSDVVGDMSREYNTDLSSVRIHTDMSAASMAQQRGVDAFSTGSDVFFGEGVFNSSDPASRGLLAHELSHSIQQGIGGSSAMTHSAPMGAEQGGLLKWFRSLFHKQEEPAPTPEEMAWEREKQKKLAALDEEDEQAAQWDAQLQDEMIALTKANEAGIRGPNSYSSSKKIDSSAKINLTDLTKQAKRIGWQKYKKKGNINFDKALTENFFREASGQGIKTNGENEDADSEIYTGYRSLDQMMEVFEKHDEATTLRFLKPIMDFSPMEFAERYPLHKMTADERINVFPQMAEEMKKLIGLKQWGEKYGITVLSEENQQRFIDQGLKFLAVTKWFTNIYQPGFASISQKYEQDIKYFDKHAKMYDEDLLNTNIEEVKNNLTASGEEIPYDLFAKIMGAHIPNRESSKEMAIQLLAKKMPGVAYNEENDMVISPVKLSELKKLAKGDKKTLNRYADKMRSLSWRGDNGRVRKAGMYDTGGDEFIAGFNEDMTYFSDMNTAAFLLKAFGGNQFMNKQDDKQDLSAKMAIAQSTFSMMNSRSKAISLDPSYLYTLQFKDANVSGTWIKRQLLESESVFDDDESTKRIDGRIYNTKQSMAAHEMIKNAKQLDKGALQNEKMREMVMDNLINGFGKALAGYDNVSFETVTSNLFRNSESGELYDYNVVMTENSGNIITELSEFIKDKEPSDTVTDQCLNMICDYMMIEGNPIHKMALSGIEATERSAHFRGKPDLQSKYIMSNYVLRSICPSLIAVNKGVAMSIMKAVNTGTSAACRRFQELLMN